MSKINQSEDDTTTLGRPQKPWWKRTEVIAAFIVVGGPAVISGITAFGSHAVDIWQMPSKETRLEHRVMLIEKALQIQDPVPFSFEATNATYLAQLGITNQNIKIDP